MVKLSAVGEGMQWTNTQ